MFSEAGGRAPYPETLASSSWAGSGYKSRSHINILLEESGVKRPWEALTKAVVFTYHLSFPRKAQWFLPSHSFFKSYHISVQNFPVSPTVLRVKMSIFKNEYTALCMRMTLAYLYDSTVSSLTLTSCSHSGSPASAMWASFAAHPARRVRGSRICHPQNGAVGVWAMPLPNVRLGILTVLSGRHLKKQCRERRPLNSPYLPKD